MKRVVIYSFFLFSFVIAGCTDKNKKAEDVVVYNRVVVYEPGDYNSNYYRIPAIITAGDGSLVICTDKRKTSEGDLPNDIDIVCNRSTNNGLSWSEPVTIAQGTGHGQGFGDCALVRTGTKDELLAIFVGGPGLFQSTPSNPIRTYTSRSTDNGMSWSEPTDITHFIYGSACSDPIREKWHGSFCASGNGLLTSSGRIILVAAVRETSGTQLNNYAVYSDDGGLSWQVSGRASTGGDEAKTVELPDGRILMSIRHAGERWYNISADNGTTWGESTSTWPDLAVTACNGDIISYSDSLLLQSLPNSDKRENVSIFASTDNGMSWTMKKTIVPYASAYSSLCILNDKTIGLYVEETDKDNGYSMVFYNFSLSWLNRQDTIN